jgi:VanZ family protein
MNSKIVKYLAWLLLAAIIFVTVSPIGLRPHTVTSVDLDRALAYAGAGFLFALAYPHRLKTVAVLLVLGALGIECLQYLSPSRHARLQDADIKALGAFAGVLFGWAISKLADMRKVRLAKASLAG